MGYETNKPNLVSKYMRNKETVRKKEKERRMKSKRIVEI
jgi:hypothetical protein